MSEEDEEKDMLDMMKETAIGERSSTRNRSRPAPRGCQLSTSQIAITDESEELFDNFAIAMYKY
jgi:hypothetical protein